MNQIDLMKNKSAIATAKKKMDIMTLESVNNISTQQKISQKNENINMRRNLRSHLNTKGQNGKLNLRMRRDRELWQMSRREGLSRRMRSIILERLNG